MTYPHMRASFAAPVLAFAAALAGAGPVQARPIGPTQVVQFDVPVHLENISSGVKSFSVQCHLGPVFIRRDVGFQRRFQNTVHLSTPPIDQETAAKIKDWHCNILFFPTTGTAGPPTVGNASPDLAVKPGTTLVTEVKGVVASQTGPQRVLQPNLTLPH
jgi:hypothetical protein